MLTSDLMQVRLGEWDASATTESLPTQETGVSSVLVHPRYYAPGVFYDLAILVLVYTAECDKLIPSAGAGHGGQHPRSQHWAGLPPLCRLGGGHCTVLYCIVLYFTVLNCTVLNCYCTAGWGHLCNGPVPGDRLGQGRRRSVVPAAAVTALHSLPAQPH